MRFLVANAENEDVAATIWLWDGNGAPMDALVLNPIRASGHDVEVNPATGEALTNFFYADIITATTDNVGITTVGSVAGIAEIRFDARGASWIFADFNTAAPSGTDGTDGICIYKGY
jgi:hypothetical protein